MNDPIGFCEKKSLMVRHGDGDGTDMQLVTKRGVMSVMRRMMWACEDDAPNQVFRFTNVDGNVDFRVHITGRCEEMYELHLEVDVFDPVHDDTKHPAVYAWLVEEYHGVERIGHWGPFDTDFKNEEEDDVRHDVYNTIVKLQRMQTCACNRAVYFDDADMCLQCDAIATSDDATSDRCCLCLESTLRFQSVRSSCCLHYMHRQCHDNLSRHARDENVSVRCPMCRQDLHVT